MRIRSFGRNSHRWSDRRRCWSGRKPADATASDTVRTGRPLGGRKPVDNVNAWNARSSKVLRGRKGYAMCADLCESRAVSTGTKGIAQLKPIQRDAMHRYSGTSSFHRLHLQVPHLLHSLPYSASTWRQPWHPPQSAHRSSSSSRWRRVPSSCYPQLPAS